MLKYIFNFILFIYKIIFDDKLNREYKAAKNMYTQFRKVNGCLALSMKFFNLRPQKVDFLFLRHFFEKTNARGRNFFLLCQIVFPCLQ